MSPRKRGRGGLAACAALSLVLIAFTVVSWLAIMALPVVAGMLAIELDRSGGVMARRIVWLASWLLPKRVRKDYFDEWSDHVLTAGEEGLRPVLAAIEIACVSAPQIALSLRLRPAAGRYILALFMVAIDVARADPDEKRRGSTISTVKAILRLPALFITPILAVPVMRRAGLPVPRWALYVAGTLIEFGLSTAAAGAPVWQGALLLGAMQVTVMSIAMVVVIKHEAVIRFASRWATISDE